MRCTATIAKISLLILVLSTACFAQSSMRKDSITIRVLDQMNTSSANVVIPVAEVTRTFHSALQQLCTDFPAIGKFDTLVVCADSGQVAFNTDFVAVRDMARMDNDTGSAPRVPLEFLDFESAYQVLGTVPDDFIYDQNDQAALVYYNVHGTGRNAKVSFLPKLDKICSDADSIVVRYWSLDRSLTSDTMSVGFDPALLDEFEILLAAKLSVRRGDWASVTNFTAIYESARRVYGFVKTPGTVEPKKP